uniref:Uncharacterized protein n=1 Tax=Physcomitrium patens TaxID=3218 RepID=A0A2K1IAK5_PHYPA|nr:hypothetical protein PHYPA_030872 [Physcomitrium patens]
MPFRSSWSVSIFYFIFQKVQIRLLFVFPFPVVLFGELFMVAGVTIDSDVARVYLPSLLLYCSLILASNCSVF